MVEQMWMGAVSFAIVFSLGAAFGSCTSPASFNNSHRLVREHACAQACERAGSEMDHERDGLCVCADLTTMRADYGAMYLHGARTHPAE